MRLFITDLDAVADLGDGPRGHSPQEVLSRAGVRALMPFVLGADGSYDARLNRYIRALPTMSVRSPSSWQQYANELVVWARFLGDRREATIWDADPDDVVAFHAARRGGATPADRVSASTWNRSVAALSKFYAWAVVERHVDRNPFVRRQRSRGRSYLYTEYGGGHELVTESSSPVPVKFLTVGSYIDFRDVGLGGRRAGGVEDPSWRGRNGNRNVLFAEFLVTTGVRLEESAALLLAELPPLPRSKEQRTVALPLARAITKGNKTRTVYPPVRVRRAVAQYIDIERALAVSRGRADGRYDDRRYLVAENVDDRAAVIDGRRVSLSLLRPDERLRLLVKGHDGNLEPAALWLTEQGQPVAADTWRSAFQRASDRCQGFGLPVEASPHTLRHTFAVHMLARLIQVQIGDLSGRPDARRAAYRHIAFDPLRKLQALLGHAHVSTTFIYLDSLAEAQELVEDAIGRFAEELVDVADVHDEEAA